MAGRFFFSTGNVSELVATQSSSCPEKACECSLKLCQQIRARSLTKMMFRNRNRRVSIVNYNWTISVANSARFARCSFSKTINNSSSIYIYIIYLYIFFILIYNYHSVLLHGMFVSKTHSLFLLSAVTTLYVTKNHSAISYIFRSRRRLFVFTLPIENDIFFFFLS